MSAQAPTFEEQIADVIIATVQMAIKPLLQRIAALESRPELKYVGIYETGIVYRPGSLATRSGSLWLCLHETRSTPGSDASSWRLIVKSGHA